MAQDPVKTRLRAIIDSCTAIFNEHRTKGDAYDFSVAAKTMAQEAYDLGMQVAQGKLPDPELEIQKKPPPAKTK